MPPLLEAVLRISGIPDGLPERLAAAKIYVGVRDQSMRVTPHLYNIGTDIDHLFTEL